MFFLHRDCCGSELELQAFLGRSGPGTPGTLVSGVLLPGQQVTPPRFLHRVVFWLIPLLLMDRFRRLEPLWAPAAGMERLRSCWAINLLPNLHLPPFLC